MGITMGVTVIREGVLNARKIAMIISIKSIFKL